MTDTSKLESLVQSDSEATWKTRLQSLREDYATPRAIRCITIDSIRRCVSVKSCQVMFDHGFDDCIVMPVDGALETLSEIPEHGRLRTVSGPFDGLMTRWTELGMDHTYPGFCLDDGRPSVGCAVFLNLLEDECPYGQYQVAIDCTDEQIAWFTEHVEWLDNEEVTYTQNAEYQDQAAMLKMMSAMSQQDEPDWDAMRRMVGMFR